MEGTDAKRSWHEQQPFAGGRAAGVPCNSNWVTSEGDKKLAMLRDVVSAPLKRLFAAMRPSAA